MSDRDDALSAALRLALLAGNDAQAVVALRGVQRLIKSRGLDAHALNATLDAKATKAPDPLDRFRREQSASAKRFEEENSIIEHYRERNEKLEKQIALYRVRLAKLEVYRRRVSALSRDIHGDDKDDYALQSEIARIPRPNLD